MARLPRFMAIKYNCFAPSKESRPSQSPGNRISRMERLLDGYLEVAVCSCEGKYWQQGRSGILGQSNRPSWHSNSVAKKRNLRKPTGFRADHNHYNAICSNPCAQGRDSRCSNVAYNHHSLAQKTVFRADPARIQ